MATINKSAKKVMETLNSLPNSIDSAKTFPVRTFRTKPGKILKKIKAEKQRIAAYKSDFFRVWLVSRFCAFRPLVLGNITMLIAPGRNKKILPVICANE